MKLLRTVIELSHVTLGRLKGSHISNVPECRDCIWPNLSCGLAVTKGWLNVDGSLNALITSIPTLLHEWMNELFIRG